MTLPDVSVESTSSHESTLDHVGMRGVEIPIRIRHGENVHMVPAKGDFFVSLDDPKAKGIHMSRFYLVASKILSENELTFETIELLLKEFAASQDGLSKSSAAKLSFDLMKKKKSLLSDNSGWRFYPVVFEGKLTEKSIQFSQTITITYSSTCPCSFELSKQIIKKSFDNEFGNSDPSKEQIQEWIAKNSLGATPHSQRSHAIITVSYDDPKKAISLSDLIEKVESVLMTAVQTAVKREDEQEFARLNGENPMFCEDAARVIKSCLDTLDVDDYRVEVEHLESLHAHDAVAIVSKH